jgi:hypothetical protein
MRAYVSYTVHLAVQIRSDQEGQAVYFHTNKLSSRNILGRQHRDPLLLSDPTT